MCAPRLPEDCIAAEVGRSSVHSPLKTAQLKNLRSAFELVEDPRCTQSRRYPIIAMLTLIALGLLMGGRDMLNISRKVTCLDQRQREANGLSGHPKKSRLLKTPLQHGRATLGLVRDLPAHPSQGHPTHLSPRSRPMIPQTQCFESFPIVL